MILDLKEKAGKKASKKQKRIAKIRKSKKEEHDGEYRSRKNGAFCE